MTSPVYYNYSGVLMPQSAVPKAWLNTTAAGQTLSGTSGPDQIVDSYGGSTLIGGAGDDTYIIVNPTTTIVEAANGGIDTVQAWIDFTLPANVEDLILKHDHTTGQGNNLGDLLIASGLNDTLIGGSGQDVFVDGGKGSDIFRFSPGGGHDVIYGFQTSGATHDLIQLGLGYGFTSFGQIQGDLSQDGADTLLTLSPIESILIRNTQVSSLTAADFALEINPSTMHMTFDEEFNSLSLYNPVTGVGTWKTNFISGKQAGYGSDTSRTLAPDAQLQIYVDPTYTGAIGGTTSLGINPFSITNGILDIHAAPTPAADLLSLDGFKYTSGLLTTEHSFNQTDGYFEIRAELPAGKGVWPAFWLLPTDGSWPPEMDVLEAVGGTVVYNTIHVGTSTNSTQTVFTTSLATANSAFHTYGVLWTAQTLNFYIDGQEVSTIATPADMNKPMYMLVNLAIGGNFPGSPPANFTGADLYVDYIHAYSLASAPPPYYVAQSSTDHATGGADAIHSAYSYSLVGLTAHTLQLTGSANLTGTGNNLTDTLIANSGVDILISGTGVTTMVGGAGGDTFYVNNGADVVQAVAGAHNLHPIRRSATACPRMSTPSSSPARGRSPRMATMMATRSPATTASIA